MKRLDGPIEDNVQKLFQAHTKLEARVVALEKQVQALSKPVEEKPVEKPAEVKPTKETGKYGNK